MYDYLIVGAGLFGCVFAREAANSGKKCLVIDKRPHIGGNVYTERIAENDVHKYGPHIFHTSNYNIWEYVNSFVKFDYFINSPIANYKGKFYNLPFNMNTFYQLWGITAPVEARNKIESQRLKIDVPYNLEEQALSLVGSDIYETLIKGYTEKQWGRPCAELPAFIIKRLPLRFTYDNNYYNDAYQGIPKGGYTMLAEKLLEGIEVKTDTPYKKGEFQAKKTVYTGAIDEFFGYRLGTLEYRTLRFETVVYDSENVQGNAVVNYTSSDVPYTRMIEHRHFDRNALSDKSVITWEYPADWKPGEEPYYPVNDEKNNVLYEQYRRLADKEPNLIFGGRLGSYRYFDMDKVIEAALNTATGEGLSRRAV